jgi:hypothetical protein
MSGRKSEHTYAVHAGSTKWAFVPHPEISGLWFRTHLCVLVSPCSYPGCKAKRGQPCKGPDGYKSGTHYMRRDDGAKGVQSLETSLAIVTNFEKKPRGKKS